MAGFGPSKTSAAQTAYNAGANITAALLTAGVFKPDPEDVVASTLEVLGGLVAAIRGDLEATVADELASAPPKAAGGYSHNGASRPAGAKPYVSADPGAERLTKSKEDGGTSEVGGMTLREIYAAPKVGHSTGADYVARCAAGAFGTEGMQRKCQAFLATVGAGAAAHGPTSPDYL